MKFTARAPSEVLERTHPQPGTRRDAQSGVGQLWELVELAGSGDPHAGAAWGGHALAGRGEESGQTKNTVSPSLGSRVGPAPSAKPTPLIAALETSSNRDLV